MNDQAKQLEVVKSQLQLKPGLRQHLKLAKRFMELALINLDQNALKDHEGDIWKLCIYPAVTFLKGSINAIDKDLIKVFLDFSRLALERIQNCCISLKDEKGFVPVTTHIGDLCRYKDSYFNDSSDLQSAVVCYSVALALNPSTLLLNLLYLTYKSQGDELSLAFVTLLKAKSKGMELDAVFSNCEDTTGKFWYKHLQGANAIPDLESLESLLKNESIQAHLNFCSSIIISWDSLDSKPLLWATVEIYLRKPSRFTFCLELLIQFCKANGVIDCLPEKLVDKLKNNIKTAKDDVKFSTSALVLLCARHVRLEENSVESLLDFLYGFSSFRAFELSFNSKNAHLQSAINIAYILKGLFKASENEDSDEELVFTGRLKAVTPQNGSLAEKSEHDAKIATLLVRV